jgi:hypothetical protein
VAFSKITDDSANGQHEQSLGEKQKANSTGIKGMNRIKAKRGLCFLSSPSSQSSLFKRLFFHDSRTAV